MKNTNAYYTTKENLKSFINDEEIIDSSSLLIQVFSANTDKSFISNLLSELTLFLPNTIIIGSTTDGEIMNGKVSSAKVVLSFTQFEHTLLKAVAVEHILDGFHSGQTIAQKLTHNDSKLLISFVTGIHTNGEEFLRGISSINDEIIVSGGHAGDNSHFIETLVFTKDTIITNGAVAVVLINKNLHVHTDYSFNWQPIGNELTITKAEDNRIYTIDGRTAVETYAYYLGKDIAKDLPHIGVEFPLILNRHGSEISRACIAREEDGSLIFGGNVYTGEKVRIGYGNRKDILSKSKHIVNTTSKKPSEVIFIYSCMTRKYFLGDEVEQEILPFQNISPVSGFFTYGEFFSSPKKELFNQTMTLVSLSESDVIHEHKINQELETQETDINSATRNGLTHLVNISTKEIQKQNEILKATNQLNKDLKERTELALIGSNDGVWDWDILDDTIYFSPRWKEMLGYDDEELPNILATWESRVHPDDIASVWADVQKNIDKETEYYENIHRIKHKKGHWVWILDRGKVQFDENGKALRMIGTHTDISKEKEDQLKLMHQAQIIEQIHDSVISTDFNGIITSWNYGSTNLLGYDTTDMIGKHITELYLEEDYGSLQANINKLLEKGEHKAEVRLVKESKDILFAELSLSLLKDEEGTSIGMIGYVQDITERKMANATLRKQKEDLRHQAQHDPLTGLPNRVLFTDRLKRGIEKSKKNEKGLAIFFIDLDKFKDINDSLGHGVGDSVLKIIAKRLKHTIRKNDTLARLSGDEFTVIMEELSKSKDASSLAKKILDVLSEPIYIDEHMIYVSGSIGISLYPEDATTAQYLLKYADTAMYTAKEEGRNNFRFYSKSMTNIAMERMDMKTSLKQAINNNEFIVHYQPQIDISTNILLGLEALVRWEHPTRGLLSPMKFIPLMEETGMIMDVDRLVIEMAMKQFTTWYEEGLTPGLLAINLSIKYLENENFLQEIIDYIEMYHFKPEWLELEITEGQMIKKPEEVIVKLKQINDLGIRVSIDDFGTGYSSLSFLKRLPIHRLKIDQSFIKDIPNDEDDMAIVNAIIALAKSLKLDLIAEGVETKEQTDFLLQNGCNNVQGYYFSQAVSEKEMKKMLLTNKW